MKIYMQRIKVVVIICLGGLAGGVAAWMLSYSVFYAIVIYPQKNVEPMVAASIACGDCLREGMITVLLMVVGAIISAVAAIR